jgi:hypothetical protein
MWIEVDMSAPKQALSDADGNVELHHQTWVDPCHIRRFECLDGTIYSRMEGEIPRQGPIKEEI